MEQITDPDEIKAAQEKFEDIIRNNLEDEQNFYDNNEWWVKSSHDPKKNDNIEYHNFFGFANIDYRVVEITIGTKLGNECHSIYAKDGENTYILHNGNLYGSEVTKKLIISINGKCYPEEVKYTYDKYENEDGDVKKDNKRTAFVVANLSDDNEVIIESIWNYIKICAAAKLLQQPEKISEPRRKEIINHVFSYSNEPVRQWCARLVRKGQPEFRTALLKAYGVKCAVTDCDAEDALEAAHIIPYSKNPDNRICNGILLRADIHILFDDHLLSIDPNTYKIILAPPLKKTKYKNLDGQKIVLPENIKNYPDPEALREHLKQFRQLNPATK